MPKVRILPSKKAFIYGTLYHAGGVAQLRTRDHFMPGVMEYVPDDTPINIRGSRVSRGPVARPAVQPQAPEPEEVDGLDEERTFALQGAISRLDHTDDAHWTKAGLADLRVLTEFAGFKVTREMANEVSPGLERRDG